MRFTDRLVIPSSPTIAACVVRIATTRPQTERINIMACCRAPQFRLCIKQGDDGSFYLRDSEAVNFSDAAEVKFVVRNRSTDAELIRYTLSGGEIILPADNVLSFEIPSATSRTLPKGRHWAEAWVTTSLGKEVSARGWLDVQDMKEFDE